MSFGKRAFCGCRSKQYRAHAYGYNNMYPFSCDDVDMMHSNNEALSEYAHQKAAAEQEIVAQNEMKAQMAIVQKKNKEEEEKRKAEEVKKLEEQKIIEEKKKHEPQAMDIDTVPQDVLLKAPTIAKKPETAPVLQKESALGSKTTYYTQYI